MTDTTQQPTTDKITLAVVAYKLDQLADQQKAGFADLHRSLENLENRVRATENCEAQAKTEITNIKGDMEDCRDDLEKLKARDTVWSGLNTTLAVLAGVLGLNR